MMNSTSRITLLLPRVVMFVTMLALVVYVMHFALPEPAQTDSGEIALNPLLQIGLFITLTIFGALVGFWLTFGDLLNRGEKQ